jgi:D-glycero-D-manno-heptose 1,7-bisphosphate phosphatase
MSRPAIFFDRDGTLIEDPGYLARPEQVRLLPGVPAAISAVNAQGWRAVVVTNQSGIARGLLTEEQYVATSRRLEELLARAGARLDGQYHCPHLPEITGPCECRKPGTLLYRRAAADLDIDLARSWWIGDAPRDVLPASALGGAGAVMVGRSDEVPQGVRRAADLPSAVALVLDRAGR